MHSVDILYPLLAMAWWTLMVLLLIPYRRFRAVFNKDIALEDFEMGESENVKPHVALANRNYMNLLELPILFYTVCLTLYVTESVTALTVMLAWVYVALRVAHSLVHVTYNDVLHRVSIFSTSNFVLAVMLISLTYSLLSRAG